MSPLILLACPSRKQVAHSKGAIGENLMKRLFTKDWEGLLKLTGDGSVPGLVTFRSLKLIEVGTICRTIAVGEGHSIEAMSFSWGREQTEVIEKMKSGGMNSLIFLFFYHLFSSYCVPHPSVGQTQPEANGQGSH